MILKHVLIILGGLLVACSSPTKEQSMTDSESAVEVDDSPFGKNFSAEQSDVIAGRLANQVMMAVGGRKAWDSTRYLSWNFFGARKLLWDKQTSDVRIDFLKQDMKILMNMRSMQGKVWKNGQELTHPDSIRTYLDRGKSIWINDSYWLVMPFKLQDAGVTLQYARKDTTIVGKLSEVLTLTFQDVGDTPDNKYEVWVDQDTKRVTQWAFYRSYKDSAASFTLPWGNYQQMGGILLSDDRGDRDLSEVKVLEKVPEGAFTNF